ncbi:disease resistance protein RUN1 [Jatropha curcas]|uniref:disease resistance protein RUN1 n=1 Tax=Jatropha curcas TaxID=180498 RepID=UPI0018938E7D|nr:disease resistance protein RUN1 [Jatropha curcas]
MASVTLPCKYDVFLSFRGEDTGKNFTSHLYSALHKKGVITFKDGHDLERRKSVSQEILNAIQESRISIVIFSRNFASSKWCLDELVEISKCMKEKGQLVLPVFYSVDPSEVRKQTGRFGESFAKYEQENTGKVQQWRLAATQLANLSGWDLQDRQESELIAEVVEEVLKKLRKSSHRFSGIKKNLVAMSLHMEEMNSCLGEGKLDDVRFVGICGMGGIGKTTIARAVYADISSEFEGSCFLANVREVEEKHGLVRLQEQLLSEILMERNITIWNAHSGINEIKSKLRHKKVLIVLDDINQLNQLKSLAGMVDWFGNGSRIIITTRDEHLLLSHGVEKIYRVEGLDQDEAFRLFCSKAFKNDYPTEEFLELSNHFVNYANGLPLALDVLGSFLFGRSINEWRSALERLKEIPNREILDKLYISFDGLQEIEKKIFLDIACFFKGEDIDYVTKVLESCGFYPEIGMRVLLSKSLIAISNDRIWMHDLLQEMGREIVRQSCYEEPGKRSRLWLYKDVYHVLSKNTGTDQVEGIVLDSCEQEDGHLSAKSFMKMKRLLGLSNSKSTFLEGLEFNRHKENFPNPLKKRVRNSKHSSLTFVNRIQLVEVQGKNCTAFARVTSYLHFLLKHSSQGLFNPSSHVSMCLAGNEVPEWFDYMGMGSSLEVELPPYWYSNKWMGFAICVVFEPNALSLSETASLSCDLHAYMSDQPLFLGRQSTEISGDTAGNMAEKIWFNFIPGSSLNGVAWGEACRKIKMTFFSNGLKVKYCGFRIIYEHDVGEQCNRLENLGFPCHNNSATSKRSHDDYCSDSIDSESGNFAKRMKMP